ncbi:MAG: site-2 protease family protein [Candidatus Rokubacteria bacterium]|nr:site-2 protease family protein [Candidatus Rokubacteria bacterium]
MPRAAGRVTIARIWGIPISVHVSWLLVFALVASSLAAGYFPERQPGWGALTRWVLGALTSLAFFASVLVHELGHSRVALRYGIPIRGITLFVFGGVAQIGREPGSPGVEFRIAIAGPLTSLALAALFGGVGTVAGSMALVSVPALWLARINLAVALFNLLPGFPLDGGRVLRAAVWAWTGSFDRANRTAAAAGEVLALALIGVGTLQAIGGDVAGGIWMALIGWFLHSAVVAGRAEAALRDLLRGATVSQAMARDCRSIAPGLTLERLVHDEVLGAGRRCFVVAEDGHLRGLLTLHEVKGVPREQWSRAKVEEVMQPAQALSVVGPEEALLGALQKMDDAKVAQLPVVADGHWLGMLDREHILHYMRVRAELGV